MTGKLKILLLCGSASLASNPALAQEPPEPGPPAEAQSPSGVEAAAGSADGDVILVTARKREESLQEVPVSVTAFTGDQLIKSGAQDFADFAQNNPNVQLAPVAGGGGLAIAPTIRGNVNASSILSVDPSVGVYVDDFIVGHVWGTTQLTVDVESVQTLKGPQGTLFGRNTTGGAILVSTVDPSLDGIEGYVRGELGAFTQSPSRTNYRIGGAINLPISDKVAVRLVVQDIRSGNYQRLDDGRELGEQDRFLARAKVLFEPTPSTEIIATAEYTKETVHGTITPSSYVDADGEPIYVNTPTQVASQVVFPSDPRTDRELKEYTGEFLGLRVTQDIGGGGSVKFVAGHRKYDATTLSSVPYILGPSNTYRPNNKETSVEVQLNTPIFNEFIDLAAGLYLYDEDLTEDTNTYQTDGRVRATGSRLLELSSTSKSAYVQGTTHLTEALNFTAGIRYTSDRKVAVVQQQGAAALPLAEAIADREALPPATYRNDNSKISYLIGLDFAPVDGVLLYATHSTGYRAGGPQQARRSQDPALPGFFQADFFLSESLKNYEAGVKLEFWDRRVTLNGAAFYQDYTDYQYQGIDANATRLSLNVDAKIKGVEGELTVRLPGDLDLSANAGYVNAEVANGFSEGFRLADVPEWTYGFSASKGFYLGADQALDLVAVYSYRGNFSSNVGAPNTNDEELGRVPGRGLLNASATFTTGPLSVALFANNLTNEQYFSHVRSASGGLLNFNQLGKPRELGVRVGYEF